MSAVDNIVQNFKKLDQSSDFSGVASQLIDLQKHARDSWKQNIDEINQRVDMKALGFPDDFKILGVNEKGRLVTTSEDGRKLQERDLSHMQVKTERANTTSVEKRGNRDFYANGDGSGSYVTKHGDTLWSIAKDTLKAQSGQAPSNTEIANAVKAIARENNIQDPNKIGVGQEIRVPTAAPRAEYPKAIEPQLPPTAQILQPRRYEQSTNPLTVPGLGPEVAVRERGFRERGGMPDREEGVRDREVVSRDRSEGRTTTKYQGSLNDGWVGFRDTKFEAERTVGQNGQIINENVKYSNAGANLKFDDGRGGKIQIDNTKEVNTRFNSESGKYESTVTDLNGSQYRFTTGQSGRVEDFQILRKNSK
jgi:hypothetical protein